MMKPSAPKSGTFARTTISDTPRVLIVSDSADSAGMYALYLRRAGFRPTVVHALDRVRVETQRAAPEIVVIDFFLLDDALEATYQVQSDPRTWNIPVLVLTDLPVPAARIAARAAGASSVVAKPCLPQHLTAELRRMLALAHGRTPVVLTTRRHSA
jgi:DNA-binding response OmpR family regulator